MGVSLNPLKVIHFQQGGRFRNRGNQVKALPPEPSEPSPQEEVVTGRLEALNLEEEPVFVAVLGERRPETYLATLHKSLPPL